MPEVLAKAPFVHPDKIEANATKIAFLRDFERTKSVYKSCKRLGFTRNLVYNEWLVQDEEFRKAFDLARDGHIDEVEGMTFMQATRDKRAVAERIFLLKSWRPERYGDRQETTVNVNHSIALSGRAKATLEELGLVQIEDAKVTEIKEERGAK